MKWTEGDKGRQLIYVNGQNDDQVLVQLGGIAGRLAGTVALKPDDSRILAESRYPATCAGLLELTKKIIDLTRSILIAARASSAKSRMVTRSTDGRAT